MYRCIDVFTALKVLLGTCMYLISLLLLQVWEYITVSDMLTSIRVVVTHNLIVTDSCLKLCLISPAEISPVSRSASVSHVYVLSFKLVGAVTLFYQQRNGVHNIVAQLRPTLCWALKACVPPLEAHSPCMTVCMSQRSSIHVIVVACIFDLFALVDQWGL